jgi:hypothetical protein
VGNTSWGSIDMQSLCRGGLGSDAGCLGKEVTNEVAGSRDQEGRNPRENGRAVNRFERERAFGRKRGRGGRGLAPGGCLWSAPGGCLWSDACGLAPGGCRGLAPGGCLWSDACRIPAQRSRGYAHPAEGSFFGVPGGYSHSRGALNAVLCNTG